MRQFGRVSWPRASTRDQRSPPYKLRPKHRRATNEKVGLCLGRAWIAVHGRLPFHYTELKSRHRSSGAWTLARSTSSESATPSSRWRSLWPQKATMPFFVSGPLSLCAARDRAACSEAERLNSSSRPRCRGNGYTDMHS